MTLRDDIPPSDSARPAGNEWFKIFRIVICFVFNNFSVQFLVNFDMTCSNDSLKMKSLSQNF